MKKLSFLAIFIFIFSLFAGCKNESNDNYKIVTSCYPIYIMALNITKDVPNVEVVNMCENNSGCLHNFQLSSEDLKKIEKSSAFVINGAGMESFLDKITSELPKVKLVDSSKGIELLENECHHDHDDDDADNNHCRHEKNPHIWMSIENCIKQVENISSGISAIDSSNAKMYKENAEKYIEKLAVLKDKISSELSNLKSKDIVTFHEAFPYFANEFGLNIVGVINHEPGEEPTMKEVKETIELVKSKNVKAIFAEPQYPSNIAQTIALETGAKVYTLDPAVTGDDSLDSYLNAMEKNLEVLSEALK